MQNCSDLCSADAFRRADESIVDAVHRFPLSAIEILSPVRMPADVFAFLGSRFPYGKTFCRQLHEGSSIARLTGLRQVPKPGQVVTVAANYKDYDPSLDIPEDGDGENALEEHGAGEDEKGTKGEGQSDDALADEEKEEEEEEDPDKEGGSEDGSGKEMPPDSDDDGSGDSVCLPNLISIYMQSCSGEPNMRVLILDNSYTPDGRRGQKTPRDDDLWKGEARPSIFYQVYHRDIRHGLVPSMRCAR